VGSTVVGQAVDTVILVLIAFSGEVTGSGLVRLIVSAYLFKVVYEVVMTPVTYWIVGFLKRTEGIDTFDYKTRFTPFATEM
jgi:hypothetical protein